MSETRNISSQDLRDLADQWRSLPRSDESEKQAASEYYDQKVFPAVICQAKSAHETSGSVTVSHLILSLGQTWHPLVLSIRVLQPEYILLLHTSGSRPLLDAVYQHCGLSPSRISTRQVDAENMLPLHRAVTETHKEWGNPSHVAIDFTGGTKAMSAGCALAGALIGARLVYVGQNKRGPLIDGHPEPGAERLVFLDNPYEIFGSLDEEQGITLFNRSDFTGAALAFQNVLLRTPYPAQAETLRQMSLAYAAWDDLSFANASQYLSQAILSIQRQSLTDPQFVLATGVKKLLFQQEILNRLAAYSLLMEKDFLSTNQAHPEMIADFVLTLYHSALRRQTQGHLDMASLLLYRAIELISQSRLARLGIESGAPDYTKFDQIKLLENFRYICRKHKLRSTDVLPEKIAMFHGFLILSALEDTLASGLDFQRLKAQTDVRNQNIYTHGFSFIRPDLFLRFLETSSEIIRRFIEMNGIDFDQHNETHRFLSIQS